MYRQKDSQISLSLRRLLALVKPVRRRFQFHLTLSGNPQGRKVLSTNKKMVVLN